MRNWQIAARTLLRRPGFTLAATLMLALGTGATTALFSLVDTILLKPLPYPHADRLVALLEANPLQSKKESLIAPVRLADWSRMNRTFEAMAGSYTENVTDTSGTEPERLAGRRVSAGFFDVFGVAPVVGRAFTKDEEADGGPGAAMISYGLWTRRYARDPRVTAQRLVIGGRGYSIAGVMPKEFAAPGIDVWIPAQFAPYWNGLRDARFLSGVGRMRSGVTIEQARQDLAGAQAEMGRQFPRTDQGWSVIVRDMKETRVGAYRRTLWLVFGAVALLMLIAVANIAGLTLAQLHQREREMAISAAMGASRAHVIAAVMREVVLIAIAGAALGAAGAGGAIGILSRIFADLPRMTELALDWRALAFAAGASLLAALVFGLIPAMQATRGDLASVLAEAGRTVSRNRRLMQRGLVIAQLALTVLLLAGAGLLLRSYYNLSKVDAGFRADHTVTFHVGAAWNEDRPRIGQMQIDVVDALERAPGVEAAGFSNFLPATGATLNFQAAFEGSEWSDNNFLTVGYRNVTAGYMRALRIQLVAGKWCDPAAALDPSRPRPTQAMVNRKFVETYANNGGVIGRHLRFSANANSPPAEIVGVVGDALEDGLAVSAAPYVYECQLPGSWPDPEYVVRTRGDVRQAAVEIRAIVRRIAPGRAIFGLKPLEAVIDDALEQPRLNSEFLASFAAAAMLLASVGLYGLISLIVASRTREIGIRIALGAGRGEILGLVFAGAGRMLAAGIALGLILTAAAQKLLHSVVFGVSALDFATLAGAALILSVVASIAALVPARRAASIDPWNAIRSD